MASQSCSLLTYELELFYNDIKDIQVFDDPTIGQITSAPEGCSQRVSAMDGGAPAGASTPQPAPRRPFSNEADRPTLRTSPSAETAEARIRVLEERLRVRFVSLWSTSRVKALDKTSKPRGGVPRGACTRAFGCICGQHWGSAFAYCAVFLQALAGVKEELVRVRKENAALKAELRQVK
jgi:hypothetical protein